jgi:hypothetical protein
MTAEFIHELLLGVLGLLYAGLLYEIRQLRKAKHSNSQAIQYALICLSLLARHVKFELPPEKDE